MMTLSFRQVDVTSELATRWLATAAVNRRVQPRRVMQFANDMRPGHWQGLNGETLKFDEAGHLIDGQHRLLAVIEADVTVTFMVAYGVTAAAQDTLDSGRTRTYSDVLKMRGEAYTTMLAAVLTRVLNWEAGARRWVNKTGPTNHERSVKLVELPWLRDVAAEMSLLNRHLLGTTATNLCFCYWLFDQVDHDDTVRFFKLLETGQGSLYHPAVALRTKLAKRNAQLRQRHLPEDEVHALMIKAWNAFRDDREVRRLNWVASEPFPEPY